MTTRARPVWGVDSGVYQSLALFALCLAGGFLIFRAMGPMPPPVGYLAHCRCK